jgi:hypothetical protein
LCRPVDREPRTRALADSRPRTHVLPKVLPAPSWVKGGKFNTGPRRNQVKFVNPTPAERKPEADYGF